MNNSKCLAWDKENVNVLTVNREVLKSCGISIIELKIDYINPVKVTVLVVDSKLL